MKRNSLLFILVLTSVLVAFPLKSDSSGVVRGIRVEGNRLTKEYIIRREIQHPVGVPFDSLIAVEDRNRIYNLEIFSDVRFSLVSNSDGSRTIIYHVIESWRIFPAPLLFFQEETGWSYGAAVMIKNFRGRNEIVQAAFAVGGEAFGAFQFQNPWIFGDHVSLQSHLFLTTYDHPFLGFAYSEIDGEVTLGRYFGYQWKLWLSGSIEEREINYFNQVKENIKHRYLQSKLQIIYDKRDIYIDPSKGIIILNELRPDFGLDNVSPHSIYWDFQISFYYTVIPGNKKWVAGGSFFSHKYFGETIPYRIMMVGGAKSVRGWAVLDSIKYKDEPFRAGLNEYYTSYELRQTLIPKRLIAPQTEFGVILAEFVDVGITDDDFFKMFKKKPIAGVGIGLRIFIPGAQMFRIDYGFGFYNGKWQSGNWHFALGHKF